MAGKVLAAYTRADTLISQVRDNKTSYYLYDGHGDVRALLNEDGRITDKYRYNAYGELVERSGETENHFLYTGEYYDGVSDLYYLRARYMSPSTGNFISMDTYEGSIYDPDCLHKYLYANGNPVTYSDPSGNMFDSISMTIQSGIQSILDNMVQIAYRGVICGLTNSIITALTGGSFSDACKSFLTGFLIGAGISAIRYFVVGAEIVSLARFYVLSASAQFIFSTTVAIFAVCIGDSKMAVIYGVMMILSMGEYCYAYGNYLMVDVYGSRGSTTIEFDPTVDSSGSSELVNYDPEFATRQLLDGGEISEESLKSMIPAGTKNTFVPSETIKEGYKYNFVINGKKVEIKWHSEDLNAASKYPDCNSGNGWTAQIKVGNKLLSQSGRFVKKPNNTTHIPLKGGD